MLETRKGRNSNLELYRIICMFLIVVHHYCVHGFGLEYMEYSTSKYVLDILSSWGKFGVDGFILISSYFMVNSKFTAKKFLKLWGQVWFYTMLIFSGFYFAGLINPEMKVLLFKRSLFPISFSMYWFVTYYVILMVLSPYINIFIRAISREQYKKLLVILIVLWSIMGSFFETDYAFSMFGWFVTLYLVAGYVRNYIEIRQENTKRYGWLAIVAILAVILSTVINNAIGHYTYSNAYLTNSRIYVDQEQDFFIFAAAFFCFMYLLNKKESNHSWINWVASLSFGVYLLHDNYFTRVYLWMVWFDPAEYKYSEWIGLWVIAVCLGVYVVASCIECVRKYTVGILWDKFIEYSLDKLSEVKFSERKAKR